MSGSLDNFKDALGGDVVIPNLERSGGLSVPDVLATRSWFDRHRRLTSSGGRPTNADWTMKRQIPFAPETWQRLKNMAEDWSATGPRFGPGQVAAFLLEDVIYTSGGPEAASYEPYDDLEPRFREWQQPELFGAPAAA